MASRHVARSAVLQALFESDMHDSFNEDAAAKILERNLRDFSHGDADTEFASSLLTGIIGKHDELDAIIVKAAPQWPLSKIAPIDRNVLRIGLFELLFADRAIVPPKVALNEAIELAKSYGGDSSGKFINGVLGAVYRDLGEPGKTDTPKNPQPLPHEALGGIVVVCVKESEASVALVHDVFGRWTLPKAKCKNGELSDAAAKRAATEELGIAVEEVSPLGEHEYIAHEPSVGRIARTVGYYLSRISKKAGLSCKACEGITDVKWVSESELPTIPTYNDLLPIIENGIAEAKKK